jgi:hypothetical protein
LPQASKQEVGSCSRFDDMKQIGIFEGLIAKKCLGMNEKMHVFSFLFIFSDFRFECECLQIVLLTNMDKALQLTIESLNLV